MTLLCKTDLLKIVLYYDDSSVTSQTISSASAFVLHQLLARTDDNIELNTSGDDSLYHQTDLNVQVARNLHIFVKIFFFQKNRAISELTDSDDVPTLPGGYKRDR